MEHKSGQRRVLRKVLLICALGIGVLLGPVAGWRIGRYYYVERAVQAFQSNPSQTGADKLIDLLDRHRPTHRQAARILKLLFQPKVVTRSAYPVGKEPKVSTLLPLYLHFHTTILHEVNVLAGDQTRRRYGQSTYFPAMPCVWSSPVAPNEPGKFSMKLRCEYLLAPSMEGTEFYSLSPFGRFLQRVFRRMKMAPWLLPPLKEWYQVRFDVPVEVTIVENGKAERVRLLSSPELDDRMRDALRLDTRSCPLHIFARRLPENVVYHCFFRLPDGTRVRSSYQEDQHLIGYAGREFEANFWPLDIPADRFGALEAKLVLEPDPNYAFDEPTIKSIWNGRLEFPVRLWGASEPNTGR